MPKVKDEPSELEAMGENESDLPGEEDDGKVTVTPPPTPDAVLSRKAEDKTPKAHPYKVHGGAIAPFGTKAQDVARHGEEARLYQPGETIYLTRDQAISYNQIGRLAPYIPGDE